ncbi:hypothetical protein N7455_007162 [Penicillium solitum]|uniref:uncharacterized protein n=1 Tax=Penicillium solitum TaxID=60172 RepID=UPI0032C45010|nr:hypothetical protein N7455_007162 [Penicillium solitum]
MELAKEWRGKGIVAKAIVPANVTRDVLKSDVNSMVQLNVSKNLIGSAMAGSIGGFNAQAANLAAAVFIATGQNPAQVVESANCMTLTSTCTHRRRCCSGRRAVSLCSSGSWSSRKSVHGAQSVCADICNPLSEHITIWRNSDCAWS